MRNQLSRGVLFADLIWSVLLTLYGAPGLAGTVVGREFDSSTLARKWSYAVYLPSDYEHSNLNYPVLYLLHGHGGTLYDWVTSGHIQQTVDSLVSSGEIPPTIIVMPDAGTTWFVDRKEKIETAFIQDLLPEVQRSFRTLNTRNGRLVAGLSMGGYGAMRFALKYPEMFAAAALLSPAIYDPEPPPNSSARLAGVFGATEFDAKVWLSLNYPALWDAFLVKRIAVPIYISSGDDDEFFIELEATKLYSLLRRNGQAAELRIVNGAHTWSVWESTIGDALRYVFRFASRPLLANEERTERKSCSRSGPRR